MNILDFFKSAQTRKEQVVERLLHKGQIDAAEATLLLSGSQIRVSIAKIEASSGGKVVAGDDNETNYKP